GSVPRAASEAHFGRGRLGSADRRPNFPRAYDLAERIVPPPHHPRAGGRGGRGGPGGGPGGGGGGAGGARRPPPIWPIITACQSAKRARVLPNRWKPRLARSAGGGMGRAGLFASRGARAASHRCRESALALRPGGVVPPARGAPLSIRIPDRDLRAAAPAQVGLLLAAVPAGGAPGGARGSEGGAWRAAATRAGRLPGTRRRFRDGGASARR